MTVSIGTTRIVNFERPAKDRFEPPFRPISALSSASFMPCPFARGASGLKREQSRLREVDDEREQMHLGVRQLLVAHLLQLEDVPRDLERVLDLGHNTGFDVSDSLRILGCRDVEECPAVARPKRDLPIDFGKPLPFPLFCTPVIVTTENDMLRIKQEGVRTLRHLVVQK